jgi:hypothetical protein
MLLLGGAGASCSSAPPPEDDDDTTSCGQGEQLDDGVCIPVSCGLGAWAGIDRSGAVVHVARWGSSDGDGSETDPVDSIAGAVALAADGAAEVVAVDLGVYVGSLSFSRAISALRIEGRCAAGVVIEGDDLGSPTVGVLGGDVTLRNVTLRGGFPASFAGQLEGGVPTTLALADVIVEDADSGVVGSGSATRVDLQRVEIRGTRTSALDADGGARIVAQQCVIEGARRVGVRARGPGSLLEILDSEVRGTEVDELGSGISVVAEDGGSVLGVRLVVADGTGPGIVARTGGSVVCESCTILGNALAGVAALDGGAIRLFDGSVTGTVATLDQPVSGVGIFAFSDSGMAELQIEGVEVSGHAAPAVYVRGPGLYAFRDVRLDDSGTGQGIAAVVAALDGVPRWEGTSGLLLQNCEITHVPLDGVLLHASSVVLDNTSIETGSGFDVWRQSCAGTQEPIDTTGQAIDNGCAGDPREVEPRVEVVPP